MVKVHVERQHVEAQWGTKHVTKAFLGPLGPAQLLDECNQVSDPSWRQPKTHPRKPSQCTESWDKQITVWSH